MGEIISTSEFSKLDKAHQNKLIIFCSLSIDEKNRAIDINNAVAEKIVKVKPERRTMKLEQCFLQVLGDLPKRSLIAGIDVMFNPCYSVDVLRLLIDVYKKEPFDLLWPGKCENGKLYYSEEKYSDYKTYSICDYDVTCVI